MSQNAGWICCVQVSLVWGKQFRRLQGMNNMDFIQVQERFFFNQCSGEREGLQYSEWKQKTAKRCLGYSDGTTHIKRATVPTPLTVCLWAHVALIAASTEPADCTHHLLLASKKAHTELYEIFIQCVHFSSLFPLSFFLFLFPTLAPLSLLSCATKQTRKTSPCHVFQLDFLPAQKHSSISLVLSQLTSLLYLPGAKTWLGET